MPIVRRGGAALVLALVAALLVVAPAGAETGGARPGPERGAAAALDAGGDHACGLLDDGSLRCWGANEHGQLGLGDTEARGDEPGELGEALPVVDLGTGRSATAVATGGAHTCVLLDDGSVVCWGANDRGQLGRGDTGARGDEPGEMGDALPVVDLGSGRSADAIAAGTAHTCALLDDGSVRCWGWNNRGQLGVGDDAVRGDEPGELGDALPVVDLGTGRTATALATGAFHTCAVLDDATLRCWGANGTGQLGLGDTVRRGDDPGELGDALPVVDLGTGRTTVAVTARANHTCALLDDGSVRCWGGGIHGQLGLGSGETRGDDAGEMGDALPPVDLGTGRIAVAVTAGFLHTCAQLDDGSIRCWGYNDDGRLGLGDRDARGDEPGEMGDALPAVDLGTGRTARAVAAGDGFTCVSLDDGSVKCWGYNGEGRLGVGDTTNRGDGPGEMGDALEPVDLGDEREVTVLPSPPAPPTGIEVTGLHGRLLLTWAPPADEGGAPVDEYRVERSDDGGSTWTAAATTTEPNHTITGLVAGTYSVRVVAVNANGAGLPSLPSPAVTIEGAITCPTEPHGFVDVDPGSFAFDDIACIKGLGITTGTGPTTYAPKEDVTREQMAAFLARTWRAVGGTCPTEAHGFVDVDPGSFAFDDIACIKGLGITTGTSEVTYAPMEDVTREQMAAFLARLWRTIGGTCPTEAHGFVDVDPGSFAFDDIACIKGLGFTTGTGPTTYAPDEDVTREQMAAFLARFIRAQAAA